MLKKINIGKCKFRKYKNKTTNNMVLRVVLNSKNKNWNDYRNILDEPLPKRWNGDTKALFNIIHNGKRGKITEKEGYRWLAVSSNYRELYDILIDELKIKDSELKDLNKLSINMTEINRSILISCNEYMRNILYWSGMNGRK